MTEEQTRLVEDNLPLVSYLLKRYFPTLPIGMEWDDMFQIGCIGLTKAAQSYDHELGYQFSTFAARVILNEIKMALRNKQRRFEAVLAETSERLDRVVEGHNGRDMFLADTIPDPRPAESTNNFDIIWDVLDSGDPTDRMLWIGMYLEGSTQVELAKRFSLSQPQVSRRIERVNRRMKVRLKP